MTAPGKRRNEAQRRLRRLAQRAMQFLLPPACVSCRRPGAIICNSCEKTFVWFSKEACPRCGRPLPSPKLGCAWCKNSRSPLREIRAVCAFEGAARAAVHALKYEGMFGVAQPMAEMMAARFPPLAHTPDLVIPIPLHPERVRERGYNQAELLARRLCQERALTIDEAALWRTRPTRPQVGLNRLQRRKNVAGAFAADATHVRGRKLLLIDDVCTSGATLEAAAAALLAQGAAAVSGYCFARPVAGAAEIT